MSLSARVECAAAIKTELCFELATCALTTLIVEQPHLRHSPRRALEHKTSLPSSELSSLLPLCVRCGQRRGAGEVGGTVMMFTTFRMWHVHGDLEGGEAGAGGAAGADGKAGAHFDEWQGESTCRCDWNSRRRGLRRRPPVFDGAAGAAGEGGQSGNSGYLVLAHLWALSPFVSPEQLRLTVRLFEAYAADALIASTGSSDGSRSTYGSAPVRVVLDSMLTTNPRPLLHALIPREASAITDVATVRRARVAAGRSGLYGGGPVARLAPSAVTAAVPTALDYATDLAAVISRLNSLSALTGVLTQAAGVSIPAINWDSLRGDLSRRRMVLVQGADALEADMKAALGDAATRLVAAQEEKERKDALAEVDLELGLLISGTGVIGESKAIGTVAKSTRDLTAKAIREFSKGIVDVKRYILRVRAQSCTFDGNLEILLRGMSIETGTGFAANADWSADLSAVNGTIANAVQKATRGSRRAELTSELACVFFAYRYRSQPRVEAAFTRFFIAAAARMDIIQQIMDIDVEQRRLTTEREGAQSQRRALASLRSDVRVQTSLGRASTTMLDQYEAARLATFRALSDLADAYHLTSLADYKPLLGNYGKQRLRANGVMSPAVDATALRRLRADLLSAYHQSTRCHAGELPAVSHVRWDLTLKRHPAFFNTFLAAGVAKTFVLAVGDADCAGGGGTSPPSSRSAPPPDQAHYPLRRRTNARVVRLGVELLIERNENGSTNSLPAYSGRSLPVVLHQMGVQSFRVNASAMATVPSRGLRMPLPDEPTPSDGGNGGGGDGGPPDTRQVCLRRGEVLSAERVRACPSPYATYMLVVGQASRDAAANAHLAAVTGVRIHAERRSWSEGCTR